MVRKAEFLRLENEQPKEALELFRKTQELENPLEVDEFVGLLKTQHVMATLPFDHQSNPRLRRVIWNPWQSNGKLKNMKNQSFEVLFHKQIRNARRGSKEKSAMKHILDDSHVRHFWDTSWSPMYACYMSFRSSESQQSNASNGAQFGVEMKEL
uniref:Uncharacterized protein n=1 Tax=Vitis vinifera TaxID=29760 RepID=A5BCF8_VITVI|nr:hypothetical protein VITISV_000610 [Vitis vinifera]